MKSAKSEAIVKVAQATTKSISMIAEGLKENGGMEGTMIFLPSDPASMMAQALTIYKRLNSGDTGNSSKHEGSIQNICPRSNPCRIASSSRESVQQFLNAACTGNLDLFRSESRGSVAPPVFSGKCYDQLCLPTSTSPE
ncbi:hypothetical protein LguiA_007274 [Lonicera macranthoides]